LSFPESIKIFFHFLLHSNKDHRTNLVYNSLKSVNTFPPYIDNLEQDPLYESLDINDQVGEPHEIKDDVIPHVDNFKPSNIQDRYKPLQLLLVLHDYPTKHYKYLPKFDGELVNPTTEKRFQAFEHLINFFEVEHDDVCMEVFSQSLQGDAKEWFSQLRPNSVSSWEELKDVFLNFWGETKSWDQYILDFHAMKINKDETVSMFNKRFHNFYYKMPK